MGIAGTQSDAVRRTDLFDVLVSKVHDSGKGTPTTRLIYVAKLNRRELNADFQKGYLSSIIGKYSDEDVVTGAALVYPGVLVHVIEASSSTVHGILRELSKADTRDSRVSQSRVILSTDDVSTRCYSSWFAAYVTASTSSDHVDAVEEAMLTQTAGDVNAFLRKLGGSLASLSDIDLRKQLYSLDSFHDDLPSSDTLLSLVPAESAPTINEYLDIFSSAVDVDLIDDEQVWPMPAPMRF